MELKAYLSILWRRRWVVLLVAVLMLGLAAAYVARSEPDYTASATLRVAKSSAGFEDVRYTERLMQTYASIITSRPVLGELQNTLNTSIDFDIEVDFPTNTELMEIAVSSPDPELSANAANTLAEILIAQSRTTRGERDYVVTIIGPAVPPRAPDGPSQALLLALGLVVGLIGGSGLALLIENLDTSLHTPERVTAASGLKMLGKIPRIGKQKTTFLNGNSPEGEAFRHLRTNIFAYSRHADLKSLLITSAETSEGKTTIVANLAYAIAQSGRKVVVIDSDLRLPTLHKAFDLDNNVGLSSLLMQEATLDTALRPVAESGVAVITSGPKPANPAELLESSHMAALLDQLNQRYDMVLLDAPAFLAVTDAAVLATLVDGVLLVVQLAQTRQEAVAEVSQRLATLNARGVGFVVSQAEVDTRSTYYQKR
jgi:capsular exopolysaccharide synthesis family protein